ncbi:hypothetical protein GQ457_09G018100 [Hibiscus cannabinus]
MNLKQEQHVAQVVASPSRAPIEKLLQHQAYPFTRTIEEKPEEEEYWLGCTTQIVTEQLSCSDEHKLECTVALLIDEAFSWWETTMLTTPTEKVTWEFFVEEFKKKYIREPTLRCKIEEVLVPQARFERGIGSSGKVRIDFSLLLECVMIISFVEARRQGDQSLDFCSSIFLLLQECPETFREGFETFSLMVPKPCPKVSKPWAEFSVRTGRFRNLDPRF